MFPVREKNQFIILGLAVSIFIFQTICFTVSQFSNVSYENIPSDKVVFASNEDALTDKEDTSAGKEDALQGKEDVLSGKEDALPGRGDTLPDKEDALSGNEDALPSSEDTLSNKELSGQKDALPGKEETLVSHNNNWQLAAYDISVAGASIDKLAAKYKAEPTYLDYIVQVEKMFGLEPCELLGLIAIESGFKPQTRMDGGSLSYSTTQMKMATAKTAHMAITKYYGMAIPYPTHDLMANDKYYAAFLAGGYLKYLHEVYKNKEESYTAYNWGINGRKTFYNKHGHYKSPYAIKLTNTAQSFRQFIGADYNLKTSHVYTGTADKYLASS